MRNPICELLYEVLVATHRGAVKEVARVAGLAERTVYDHCTDGRLNPSLEVIKAAWVVTQDPRLRRLLEPRGWRLVPDQAQVRPDKDVEGEAVDVSLSAGDLIRTARELLADGHLSAEDELAFQVRLQAAEKELAELREAVRLRRKKDKARRSLTVAKRQP